MSNAIVVRRLHDPLTRSVLHHPFHPILKSFLIFGIELDSSNHVSNFRSAFYKFWTICVTFFYHYWIVCDVLYYARYTVQENALAESVTDWTSVLTFDILLWKRKSLQKLMTIAKLEALNVDEHVRKKLEKIALITCCFVWLYTCIFVIQFFVFSTDRDFQKHHTSSPLSYLSCYVSESHKIKILLLDRCTESFFTQGILTLTIALYLLLCLNAIKWFQELRSRYTPKESSTVPFRLPDIQRFLGTFDDLSQNVRRLDSVFSKSVAVWLLMILFLLCVRIVTIVNPTLTMTNEMVVIFVFTFTRAAATLIGINFMADSLHKEALTTLFHLDDLCGQNKIILNNSVYHEIQMAFVKFSFSPTHLTFWQITRLNRRFLMTCLGMMATYVIVAVQLYPNTMEG